MSDSEQRGDLEKFCRANWDRIPEEQRRKCVDHLRSKLSPKDISICVNDHKRGARIGAGIDGFHFGGGMAIRNTLREVMRDAELPPVVGPAGGYPVGEVIRNWDDFYIGALEQLAEEAAK